MTLATLPKADNEEIAHFILDQLAYGDDVNILCYLWGPVSEGDKITSAKGPIYTIPCSGYVMYIDLYPTANLFHPVTICISERTNKRTVRI